MTQYMSLNEIYLQLQQKPGYMDLGRGATQDEIRNIEDTLQVKLPEEYVDFLLRFGFMLGDGVRVSGVCPPELNEYVSVVEFTKNRRTEQFHEDGMQALDHNAVVVQDNGESYIALFCEGHPRAGQAVWRYLSEKYQDAENFDNFPQFLTFWLD
ncbi:SMI1/KNR4 family protein [Endozoicomonas sp. SM1973]|uniref:SMI1/KNR4 family protein n=1 Tax=Spartinivicinus marinus TaxID=2994442 RepID=A0A853I8E7_9GAMM|nr:SMI1/KNR4 family protein [Spartinivicinus marinus]NYZ69593.1 SMI1/KNR4 family protein [Spartinivicinus marinus]